MHCGYWKSNMQPLINITRLKGVETQLKRLADIGEMWLRLAYNYNMTAPKVVDPGKEPESLEYSDDEKTTLLEVRDLLTRNRITEVEDD